ncbi:glycoside hydrolase family 2 protein [Amycolatopsis sp. DG1A-15b]|uniref:glycoside hydrolase family 2 protein n=1 Tax=Amycolatopsis sp. DG1A-15b TaxID=3052846 RepID=UPI00255B45F3|nr:glycoside hydrolase family 2 protein [Amycolatopsis sp. DG1A-15b]WIX92093.1 glycoside hydrolase family 2 protein [Amycolatopsis sp. DG1A-15b]
MNRQELHDGWRIEAVAGPVPDAVRGRALPATVPGSAHLDLLAAGLIEDPYLDTAEAGVAWMHRAGWRYTLEFESSAPASAERADLVFDGLDTVAAVTLNGRQLGRAANMHRTYRFDVRGVLRDGANTLTVEIASALTHAEAVEAELGWRDHAYPSPFNMIRKMACSFGWDWGPDLQTAGIWKPVRLERWTTARLATVRPLVTVDEDGTGRVTVHADVERAAGPGDRLELVASIPAEGRTVRATIEPGDTRGTATLTVPDVRLWWPAGYGEHPLYDLEVGLAGAGTTPDAYRRRVGFRTVTVDTEPDEAGTPFTFVVNGTPVFAKGANWIPDDHFLTRISRDRLARRVEQALGANLNLLRVWGGGIYETEDFYDVCDERGVLVWQDFPFACASYPEEEPLWTEVEAEARENVARLTPHASLVLWNGNNENLWGFADWGWPEQLDGRTWGLKYYTELLPAIVAELDPTRPYAPGSPYSPGDFHPNDPDHGTRHEWDVWNRVDYTHYRDHIPRFCSEFGFQGPPTWATLTRWIHDDPLTPTSPAFLRHQKAEDGNGKLDRGLAAHLPRPAAFPDWHWATQLNQARAVAFGIEHFRSWWPRTAGAVVWQLNDCWPVTSWAAIDSDERLKPLWYALKHAFAPRLLTVQPRDGEDVVIAVNDTATPWSGDLELETRTVAGQVTGRRRLRFTVPARSTAELAPAGTGEEVLVATTAETRLVHVFGEDLEHDFRPAPLSAEATAVPGGYRIDVTASALARDVALLVDRVAPDAVVDDMLITLLPGETRSFLVRTANTVDPAAFADPLVLRSANALGSPVMRS